MIIAIDYDKTWTVDPEMWRAFVIIAVRRGHTVVMVTGRKKWSDDMGISGLPPCMRIIYAGDEFKQRVATAAGVKVYVWIDDMPGTIQPGLLIDTSERVEKGGAK